MRYRHGQTFRVLRHSGTDQWGQPLPGTEHPIHGCALAPRTNAGVGLRTTEEQFQAGTVASSYGLFVPVGADITAQDVIVGPDGTRYHVEGDPADWRSPMSGWGAGMEIPLTKVTG